MSLIKCHECGNEVSTESKTCPKCGAKVKKPPKKVGLVGILVALVFGIFIFNAISHNEEQNAAQAAKTPEQLADDAKAEKLNSARFVCEDFVTKTLNDPKSAEFDDYRKNWAKEEKPGIYHVQTKLRARNGFNALRQTTIDCRVTLKQGNWIALSIGELH